MPGLRVESVYLRWLVYGYVLGLLGWLVLVSIFLSHDWTDGRDAGWAFDYLLRKGKLGFAWAIPWAIANSVCSLASKAAGPRVTAAAAVTGIAAGVAYNFTAYTFGGWLAVTIPVYCIPLMVGAVGVAYILGRRR